MNGWQHAVFSPWNAAGLFFSFLWYNSSTWLVTQHGYYRFIIIITVTCRGPRLLLFLFLFLNLSIKNNSKWINSMIKRINSIMLSPPHLRTPMISMPCLSNHVPILYNYLACLSIYFFHFCGIIIVRSLTTVHYFGIISVFCNVRGVDAGAS